MFVEETITRKCVITLMGGYKVVGTLSIQVSEAFD